MTYVKKLVLHGFKSFANKTELPFDEAINVIIGPNGSGKSNISDALCFVLGRLSSKSMRVAKASNLIFQGTKIKKPSQDANVELVLDNKNKTFNVNNLELNIKRIVRRNGQSVYKINGETKTRQEVLELLAQGGIDPNGFNLVLQGEIARLVKMRSDERREIIEEISGISIYETRKQKSLREIEKTEQKLKEVSTVLRERTSYLKNLEQERKQALKYKELEQTIKRCKVSILNKKIEEKIKLLSEINKDIEKNNKLREKIKYEVVDLNKEVTELENKIGEINKHIQRTTGFERDALGEEITDINTRIATDKTRKENFEKRFADNEIRKSELESNLIELENDLEELKKESPRISKKQDEITNKKKELENLKDKKDLISSAKYESMNIEDKIKDKENILSKAKTEIMAIYSHIESLSNNLSIYNVKEANEEISSIKLELSEYETKLEILINEKLNLEKELSVYEAEIKRNQKLKKNLPNSEICPLCQIKITKEHKTHIVTQSDEIIKINKSNKEKLEEILLSINKNKLDLSKQKTKLLEKLSKKENELTTLNIIEEKKQSISIILEREKEVKQQIETLKFKLQNIGKKISNGNNIEEQYNKLFFELQELSSITDKNLNTTILYKEREVESISHIIKGIEKDRNQLVNEIDKICLDIKENEKSLKEKQKSFEQLNEKFKEKLNERTEVQDKIKEKNIKSIEKQNIISRFNEAINDRRVTVAKISAEKESLDYELKEFPEIPILSGTIESLNERLKKSEATIMLMGNVNLRALETYDEIKEEYDKIAERVNNLDNEKNGILAIISEIDRKKKRTFMKTFNEINELFTRNFSQLSTKGKAFLELENKENIFDEGATITIKVAQGKYFDVTSLSGGEQTLIALSLIFAIQEYKPYAFYILDEIDASLDKRNSELLSNLLKKYVKSGQYLMISHNDSIIKGANTIYGVSMNNGISKVLSLDVSSSNETSVES